MLKNLLDELKLKADKKKAEFYPRFFKTAPGEYGYGDVFLGVTVPIQREIAKKYFDLSYGDLQILLNSKIHEHRLVALFILNHKYRNGNNIIKNKAYNFYVKNLDKINNWDLVDSSAPYVLGEYLEGRSKDILYKLVKSANLWERRIAIIATFAFIKKGQFIDALKISSLLLCDNHDLIHKAVGWMLREVGKRDQEALESFLIKHIRKIPRTSLRYAIERLDEKKRYYYLKM